MNISTTEVKLFTIRYGISQVTQMQDIDIVYIVIITNTIPAAKWIFYLSIQSYQLHTIAISSDLRNFFNNNKNNLILFWDYPSSDKWPLYLLVDKELKCHRINPILPNRIL